MADTTVYEYPVEVIVEVIGSDEFGEIDAITYQFSYVDGAEMVVAAKRDLDEAHVELTEEALAENGYRLTASET